MRTELLETLAHIITVNCYWIRVADTTEHHPYGILRDKHIEFTTCRHLTLEITHSRGQHYIGHRWHIPEFGLDVVLCDMFRSDPSLRKRCRALKPTLEDIDTLIKRASYGIIDLELVDDDFLPLIYRHQIH